jgi:TonB-dependent receptor
LQNINVQLETDAVSLDEIVITAGVRNSQLQAVKIKRQAASVIEAITPEDIGAFSDVNVADALQRVPGVQIERNVDGITGDRVSLRGIGPQFVGVTINGRTPLSAGNEGRSDFRVFNLNIIPTEIINRAIINKTSQAHKSISAIGGAVDFSTIKPLDYRYAKGKKLFGSISENGLSNSTMDNIKLNSRFSGVLGGKITDNLGVIVSAVYADEQYSRDETVLRDFRNIDFRVDGDNDGVWNPNNPNDVLYKDALVPRINNNVLINENRHRLGLSTALQWKASDRVEITFDYVLSKFHNNSNRDGIQTIFNPGGPNGLFGQRVTNFFAPGTISFNNNVVTHLDASGTSKSRVLIRLYDRDFNNQSTNNIAGLNTKYKISDKLIAKIDLSYSDINFLQDLSTRGNYQLGGFAQGGIKYDFRSVDKPYFRYPNAITGSEGTITPINAVKRQIKTLGDNYTAKLDFDYEFNEKSNLTFGTYLSKTNIETRTVQGVQRFTGRFITAEQRKSLIDLVTPNNLTSRDFLNGLGGVTRWLQIPGKGVFDMFPVFAAQTGGTAFNFDTNLRDVKSETGQLPLRLGDSWGAEETTFATYFQYDSESTLFNLPVKYNIGVRAINTTNNSKGFSAVSTIDPGMSGGGGAVDGALYHETENSDWHFLPSLNTNFELRSNMNLRIAVSKVVSRPRYQDMAPRNSIRYIDPNSSIFDPSSPDYEPNLGTSTLRGTITSGNPDLKPYSAWMFDTTYEIYSKNGGSFVASVFYKSIKDFIGVQSLANQPFSGFEELGVNLPSNQQDLLFTISKPINSTDAKLYGFELGFNQHFTFLPGFAKGFGLQANYTNVGSEFDEAVGDAVNGFPGTSKDNFNTVLYYEKYGFTGRFTVAHRGNYLSRLGGTGSTRADASYYTESTTMLGASLQYRLPSKKVIFTASVANLTGEDVRRYLLNDPKNLFGYFERNPIWTFGLRYKL